MAEETIWKKASRCGSSQCLEVCATENAVHVRDANDRHGPKLAFDVPAWTGFCAGLRKGTFDR